MNGVTQLPTWAVYGVSFGVPALAFLGVVLGHWLTRRATKELEARSRREQLLKALQWAAELAVDTDHAKSNLGVVMLLALADSKLSDPTTEALVDAALDAVVAPVADEVDEHPNAEIAEVDEVDTAPGVALPADTGPIRPTIHSEQEPDRKGEAK